MVWLCKVAAIVRSREETFLEGAGDTDPYIAEKYEFDNLLIYMPRPWLAEDLYILNLIYNQLTRWLGPFPWELRFNY